MRQYPWLTQFHVLSPWAIRGTLQEREAARLAEEERRRNASPEPRLYRKYESAPDRYPGFSMPPLVGFGVCSATGPPSPSFCRHTRKRIELGT